MAIAFRKLAVPVRVFRHRALVILALFCGCAPDRASMPAAEPPPIKPSGAPGIAGAAAIAPAVASTATVVPAMTAGRSASSTPMADAGKSAAVAGSGGRSAAGVGGATPPIAAIGGSGGGGGAVSGRGGGAAGFAAIGGSGGAAGDDGSGDPLDPTQSDGSRDVNGPCKDLDLFCFDPFDMFIFNPECTTCNSGMGCQSCENFQAI